jgi:selenocysteine lyase/cysteine desulfurase
MKSYKQLFSRTLKAAPERLHFAAHSHHLWPDASYEGHLRAWEDASRLADRKWEKVFEDVIPTAQNHIAGELGLPDRSTLAFGTNTHELLLRLFSAKNARTPLAVLTSDGEFHSFRRQAARWEEQGLVHRHIVPCEPFGTFTDRFLSAVEEIRPDIAFVSHVMYQTGLRFDGIDALAPYAQPDGTWVVVDGYHAFMAMPVDLSRVADRVFYLGGGYKYAMAGEGAAFLHAPPGFGAKPGDTGWFAEFADIEANKTDVPYSKDGMRFMGATFDPSGLYRFNAVREMLLAEQLDTQTIYSRVQTLQDQMEAAILSGRMGRLREAKLLRPNSSGSRPRFIALRDDRASTWKALLMEHDIVTDARGDVLRIGFGLYHDEIDIPQLTERMARLAFTSS